MVDEWPPSVWHGIIDPVDGEPISPIRMGDESQVPKGVLRGIEDTEKGRTASVEDIKEVLKYD